MYRLQVYEPVIYGGGVYDESGCCHAYGPQVAFASKPASQAYDDAGGSTDALMHSCVRHQRSQTVRSATSRAQFGAQGRLRADGWMPRRPFRCSVQSAESQYGLRPEA